MNKEFVFKCYHGKQCPNPVHEGYVDICYNDTDMESMKIAIDADRGYGRIRLSFSKKNGRPYCEILMPQGQKVDKPFEPPQPERPKYEPPAEEQDNLPF